MVGWHDPLDDMSLSEPQELVMDREAWRAEVQSPGVCSPTHKELGMTERLN